MSAICARLQECSNVCRAGRFVDVAEHVNLLQLLGA